MQASPQREKAFLSYHAISHAFMIYIQLGGFSTKHTKNHTLRFIESRNPELVFKRRKRYLTNLLDGFSITK